MADFVDNLLSRAEVNRGRRASQSSLDAISERIGTPIPRPLSRLWCTGKAIAFETLDAHVPSPAEILQWIDDGSWGDELIERGFVPILDDHQSNYLAVTVRAPLAFRIVHLPHDDESRLLYRDLDSFAKAMLMALDAGESADSFFRETQGDYSPDAPRSPDDQDAARALLATDGTHGEWNYAIQMLDATNLAEWAKLLETDHFVRRDAVARMRQIQAPALQELLKRDQLAFEEFARAATDAARRAGLKVGQRKSENLQIGGTWMNLDVFFYRRNIRDAMRRMIAWFEDLIAGRNPYDRPGHFMMD
ncbi:MAG TPA: hypothetical protein VMG10_09370 [Gemmataceae bacterium]|nr:hypothetical protein [Gemmataceae bacterium]